MRRAHLMAGLSTPLLGLLIVPVVALLVETPPAAILQSLSERATWQAISLSLSTSVTATALVVLSGTPLAHALARGRLRFRKFIEVLIDVPTVLPPAVAGVALLMAFGRRGLLGSWLSQLGIELAFTPAAVVLAQMFVAAPYYLKTATVGLASVAPELEEAAAVDGARPLQVFRRITLPLAWRAVLGGAALCWARALGEFGATIIFAGNYPGRTQTMPLAIYLGFEIELGRALTLASLMLLVSFGVLLLTRLVWTPRQS